MIKGFDLSAYQKGINYDALSNQGEFVILKVGEKDFKDKLFDTHYWECKQRGLKIGAYYFSRAITIEDAYKEAINCKKFLNGKLLDLPIYYDIETKIHTKLGKNKLTEIVNTFYKTLKENTTYKIGLYVNPSFMENYLDKNIILSNKDLHIWLAHWTYNPENKSNYNYGQEVWQWGITKIDGKDVDADIWLKETNDFKQNEIYCIIAHKTVETITDAENEVKKLEAQGYDVFIGNQDDIENDY